MDIIYIQIMVFIGQIKAHMETRINGSDRVT